MSKSHAIAFAAVIAAALSGCLGRAEHSDDGEPRVRYSVSCSSDCGGDCPQSDSYYDMCGTSDSNAEDRAEDLCESTGCTIVPGTCGTVENKQCSCDSHGPSNSSLPPCEDA